MERHATRNLRYLPCQGLGTGQTPRCPPAALRWPAGLPRGRAGHHQSRVIKGRQGPQLLCVWSIWREGDIYIGVGGGSAFQRRRPRAGEAVINAGCAGRGAPIAIAGGGPPAKSWNEAKAPSCLPLPPLQEQSSPAPPKHQASGRAQVFKGPRRRTTKKSESKRCALFTRRESVRGERMRAFSFSNNHTQGGARRDFNGAQRGQRLTHSPFTPQRPV
jgi:hypothetical protein